MIRKESKKYSAKTPATACAILISFFFLIAGCDALHKRISPDTEAPEESSGIKDAARIERSRLNLFGKKVLALYKSTENQTDRENLILYHLADILNDMGFTIEYWDIDSGIPDSLIMQEIRVIISWYGSPEMEDPVAYLDFIDRSVNEGRKFIVIDNFGAWRYRKEGDEVYVDIQRLNLTLSKLGLWYLGEWAQGKDVIAISEKVPEMVEAGGKQILTEESFYYYFLKVDRDLDVYLSLKRKDEDFEASPVIVSNRNGGFVFSTYIYRMDQDGTATILIDFRKFLKTAIFPSYKNEHIGLIADTGNDPSRKLLEYATEILARVKLPFTVITRDQFERLLPGDLSRFSAVGLMVASAEGLNGQIFEDYLDSGGSLVSFLQFFASSPVPWLASTARELSEKEVVMNGYRINGGFALGESVSVEREEFRWQCGFLFPDDTARVLGTDFDDTHPLLWSAEKGNGKVLVWNWDGFLWAELVGLILESFLYVRPVGVCGTLGIGHLFIDDWPLPMYNVTKEPVETTDTEFYTEVWWPDVKNIIDRFEIPYSAYLIFNYNATVEPPFTGGEFFAADNMASLKTANELMTNDREVGFHGYNHMSLTREKTNANINKWPSIAMMEGSLTEGKKTWINLFGENSLPFGYVAVNNIISEEGIIALHRVFPSIRTVSALRWGTEEETYTEIGPHPRIPSIYFIPRISFGYRFDEQLRTLVVSGMSGPGFISHFIHPDDVYDEERSNGKNWETLKEEFAQIFGFIRTHYPWVEWLGLRELHKRLLEHDATTFTFRRTNENLEVFTSAGGLFRVRLNGKRLEAIKGGTVIHHYRNQNAFIIKTHDRHCVLTIR
ncbi:MAG: DUF2194 domain-containing protein [Spirochaetales bacterium]|nr:DUF2194 domain-containing protein [Spirochaetales bacterium]